jgi:hypothetical protein
MLVGHAFGRVIARRARARASGASNQALGPFGGDLLLSTSRSSGEQTVVVGWRRTF